MKRKVSAVKFQEIHALQRKQKIGYSKDQRKCQQVTAPHEEVTSSTDKRKERSIKVTVTAGGRPASKN
jgi:hypothetical protein